MRNHDTDVNMVELSTTRSTSQAHSSYSGDEHPDTAGDGLLPSFKSKPERNNNDASPDPASPETQWPRWMQYRQTNELIYFLSVVACAIPIILLVRYASRLSAQLGSQACLPNGDFILPGTVSIWSLAYLFTITVTAHGANINMYGDTGTWTYTSVRVLDLLWDVVMGRGGQLLLIYIAYRVFSQSLGSMMETGAVSYPTYSAVSFDTTSMRSVWQYLLNAGWKRPGRIRRSRRIFLAMALGSLYVVSMPTLFSAMTGYAPVYVPSLELLPASTEVGLGDCQAFGNCSVLICGNQASFSGDGLAPGWGVVIDSMRLTWGGMSLLSITYPSGGLTPIALSDAYGSKDPGVGYYIRQYYEQYEAAYKALGTDPACRNVSTLQECPATNIESVYHNLQHDLALAAPLLNIQLWSNDTTTGVPIFWLCNGVIINVNDFDTGNVTGICNAAGTSYQWGFSFLMLLIVCILHLVFAVTVYALWIDARRHSLTPPIPLEKKVHPSGHVQWRAVDYPSTIGSVIHIAAQARSDHGDGVFQWEARKLEKEVWQGKQGIRARKPISVTEDE